MKVIDFDAKFFEYARKWVAAHPGLTEQQVEDSYNRMMQEWIAQPADWLDGATPETYFQQFDAPQTLIEFMKAYAQRNINLPEPLYSRIVELGEVCAPMLKDLLMDAQQGEELRAEAMGMLRDMDSRLADDVLEELVCTASQDNELSNMAADILSGRGAQVVPVLLERFERAPDYAQDLILDICCNFPGDERVYAYLIQRLRNRPEQRALWASYLGKLGDARAIEPMLELMRLSDLRYLDYIELRAAVEALGGDAGEERSFYGDPDFEALRML